MQWRCTATSGRCLQLRGLVRSILPSCNHTPPSSSLSTTSAPGCRAPAFRVGLSAVWKLCWSSRLPHRSTIFSSSAMDPQRPRRARGGSVSATWQALSWSVYWTHALKIFGGFPGDRQRFEVLAMLLKYLKIMLFILVDVFVSVIMKRSKY